jgi:hypothetical protein
MAFYHDPHAPDDLQWTSVLSGCPSAGKSVEIPVLNDHFWLVVDLPLWKMMEFVSWDYDIPNIWKHRKCSKSPTRFSMGISYMPCLNSSIFCLVFYIQKKRQQTQTVSEIMLQSLPESLVRSSRLWLSFRSPAAWWNPYVRWLQSWIGKTPKDQRN